MDLLDSEILLKFFDIICILILKRNLNYYLSVI